MTQLVIAQLPLPAEASRLARVLVALGRAYPGCDVHPGRRRTDGEDVIEVRWTPPREDVP